MNLHNISLVDSCQKQQTAMNIGIAAGRVPQTHSLVKLVRTVKKQAIKAFENGPKCKQQMKKHVVKET